MTPLDNSVLIPLLVATVLGAILGIERALAGKHAGMRTYALVSLGSAVFSMVGVAASFELGAIFGGVNPIQIAASIVLGVGFIGAGLATLKTENHVELTTATGLWVAAGVGMASGFGLYTIAVITAVLAVLIFSLLLRVETAILARYGNHN